MKILDKEIFIWQAWGHVTVFLLETEKDYQTLYLYMRKILEDYMVGEEYIRSEKYAAAKKWKKAVEVLVQDFGVDTHEILEYAIFDNLETPSLEDLE